MKVFFIGAGPGDPELLTVKGLNILRRAPVVIYAGSLINPQLLKECAAEARLHDSATLTLEEVTDLFTQAFSDGQDVARLHSGDPSLYGALQEQIRCLEKSDIPYEIVPGVTSLMAAAAALNQELTVPGVSQTVIITRLGSRTPVPPQEDLAELARTRSTMAIFLSVQHLAEVTGKLLSVLAPSTPAAVVARASWPEEQIIQGRLADICELTEAAGIERTALVIVGDILAQGGVRSRLYDPDFAHGFREGRA